jgi:hypothetical protein
MGSKMKNAGDIDIVDLDEVQPFSEQENSAAKSGARPVRVKILSGEDIAMHMQARRFIEELQIREFIQWANARNDKTHLFTVLHEFPLQYGIENLLKTYFMCLSNRNDVEADSTALIVNFLLTSKKDEDDIDGYWSNAFIDVNRLDESDGKSIVHFLAASRNLHEKHMHKALETFGNVVLDISPGSSITPVFRVRCTPDLSKPTRSGDYPIGIATQCRNTAFLKYFGIGSSIHRGLTYDGTSDPKDLKKQILEIMDDFTYFLEDAKRRIR